MEEAVTNNKGLAKIGIGFTLAFLMYSLLTMVILAVYGVLPDKIEQILNELSKNYFIGLIKLDILTIMFMPVYFVIYFCIYKLLLIEYKTLSEIAFYFCLMGFILFLSSPTIFPLAEYAKMYTLEQDNMIRNKIIIIGEMLYSIDMWHGSSGIIGGLLIQVSAVLFSLMMLKSSQFNKKTAIIGLTVHIIDIIHFFTIKNKELTSSIMAVAGTLYIIWFIFLLIDFNNIIKRSNQKANTST